MTSPEKPVLQLHIISPSQYDDNGIVKQYPRVLMISGVFGVLNSLAEQAAVDSGISISIKNYNERTERGDGYLKSIVQSGSEASNNLVFITAKSYEVPRAIRLAEQLKEAGMNPVLGGPGITLADCETYQYLVEKGIPFNVGEGENTVGQIIRDAVAGKMQPVYWQDGFVDMRKAPLPKLLDKREHRFAVKPMVALDTSEGCPYGCTFCAVRIIRGTCISAERSRNPDACMAWIEEASSEGRQIFLIDDNLRESFTYKALQEPLIALNQQLKKKGKELYLFVQVDARPTIIDEAKVLSAMGVKHAFFGMETRNKEVLAASKKNQNKPERFQDIVDAFHKERVAVGTGVMVGFWNETPRSIHEDMEWFSQLVDLAHPYAVIPVPGTPDYLDAVRERQLITPDLNFYDGAHFVRNWFTKMTLEDAKKSLRQSFPDLFPLKNLMRPTVANQSLLYGRFLATLGRVFFGQEFHIMMDGPKVPFLGPKIKRPANDFTGFTFDPEDSRFKDIDSYEAHKRAYLSNLLGRSA